MRRMSTVLQVISTKLIGLVAPRSILNLASNQLSGSVPAELGGLSSLTVLNLGGNALSGPLPPAAVAGWRGLQELHLEVNAFEVRCGEP